jgi:phosphoribosylamine--glycine ligase
MDKHQIPTAGFHSFSEAGAAKKFIAAAKEPVVVKADGLAAGKGVILCADQKEALAAVDLIMRDKAFGEAGKRIVIEEMLLGEEASFLAFTDGENVLPLASCQDHKAIYDGDKGPNTGGMGAYSPAPVVTPELHDRIMKEVMIPTVRAMKDMGRTYTGVLYAGLMIKDGVPKVLEFNARFGDPETQPLLFRMKSDIIDLLLASARPGGSVKGMTIEWGDPTVTVVMAAKGYPGSYSKGFEIKGLDQAAKLADTYVFHAGTSLKDGKTVTSGGRVLGVTARGATVEKAIANAYRAVDVISWDGAYCRRDIGKKAVGR